MTRCILGIDPGMSGAIAFYFPSYPERMAVEDMPVVAGEVDAATLAKRINVMAPAHPRLRSSPVRAERMNMKASTLQSFLDECRAAKTSDEIALVVDQIEHKIGSMRAERSKLEGQLQEAIVAGRDPGKIHTAIAQMDQDLVTLQAAMSGFSQKQAAVRKREEGDNTKALVSQHEREGLELDAATKEFAAAVEKAPATGARVAGLVKQHD
jgi:hypothetical protein